MEAMDTSSSCHELYEKYVRLLTAKSPSKSQEVNLSELGYLVENLGDFLSCPLCASYNRSSIVVKLTEFIVSFGIVKSFNDSEDRDFDVQDFPFIPENAEVCVRYIRLLMNEYEQLDTTRKCHFIIHILLLCATHNRKYQWSSENSIMLCDELLDELLLCTKHNNLSHLLCSENFHPTIFKGVLKFMRPFLLKDTWIKNPSSCHVFFFILSHVQHPNLEEYLCDIFPPPFMFTSYFAVPQQVLGIKCFDHILDNVPPTLIKVDGKEDAIYHTLTPLIYSKEYPIIEVLYPCLLKLPMMKQQRLGRMNWTQYDHVLHHLLLSVEFEGSLRLQRIYLSHVYNYIESVPPFKQLKRILKVLDRKLSVYDGPEGTCRLTSLKIMRSVIKLCWPRMEYYCFEILKVVLRQINDLEDNEDHLHEYVADEIYSVCEECLCLLRNACYEKFETLSNDCIKDSSNMPGLKFLKSTVEKTSNGDRADFQAMQL